MLGCLNFFLYLLLLLIKLVELAKLISSYYYVSKKEKSRISHRTRTISCQKMGDNGYSTLLFIEMTQCDETTVVICSFYNYAPK